MHILMRALLSVTPSLPTSLSVIKYLHKNLEIDTERTELKCHFVLSKNDTANTLCVPGNCTLQLTNVQQQLNSPLTPLGICIVGLVCCGFFSQFSLLSKIKGNFIKVRTKRAGENVTQ